MEELFPIRITKEQYESMKRASPGWELAKEAYDKILAEEIKKLREQYET